MQSVKHQTLTLPQAQGDVPSPAALPSSLPIISTIPPPLPTRARAVCWCAFGTAILYIMLTVEITS